MDRLMPLSDSKVFAAATASVLAMAILTLFAGLADFVELFTR
ncbi:hypothetical protein MBENS4_1085 [Novosphingobium sp. MBES04]|nr:hypothetical protein MBENS4_1085 [Novosphingobium sp. MBES04]